MSTFREDKFSQWAHSFANILVSWPGHLWGWVYRIKNRKMASKSFFYCSVLAVAGGRDLGNYTWHLWFGWHLFKYVSAHYSNRKDKKSHSHGEFVSRDPDAIFSAFLNSVISAIQFPTASAHPIFTIRCHWDKVKRNPQTSVFLMVCFKTKGNTPPPPPQAHTLENTWYIFIQVHTNKHIHGIYLYKYIQINIYMLSTLQVFTECVYTSRDGGPSFCWNSLSMLKSLL